MKYKAVIGLGFGDEGKGLFTDYLSSRESDSLVIRFNGGQQAGHTVASHNFHHVFSNFGSGSYRGLPSYFSSHCTIYPVAISREIDSLISKGVNPVLYIDDSTPVTTPYDIAYNHKYSPHGTVGVGFGATLQREEDYYSLKFIDLFYPYILEKKIESIQSYYKEFRNIDLNDFFHSVEKIKNSRDIISTDGIPSGFNSFIFEGAQGLLLDQNIGFFPFVTRSSTGTKNILNLIGEKEIDLYLVTRGYQTRHGSGPLSNEAIPNNIKIDPKETNIENKYQGKFRYGILDLSLIEYAISRDNYIKNSRNKNLVITCLDHIESEYRFTYGNKIVYSKNEMDFISKISEILNIKNVFLSRTEFSKNIEIYNPDF